MAHSGAPAAALGGLAWGVLALGGDERVADVSFTDSALSVSL
jgi:hypothetical protein